MRSTVRRIDLIGVQDAAGGPRATGGMVRAGVVDLMPLPGADTKLARCCALLGRVDAALSGPRGRLSPYGTAPTSRSVHPSGAVATPSTRTSQCRCGPVTAPVAPTAPMTSPGSTTRPTSTVQWSRWA